MIRSKTKTIALFGKGDILISMGVDYDKKTPMVTFTNREKGEIGEYDTSIIDIDDKGMPRVTKFDIKMTFSKAESIDVLIHKLKEAKKIFNIPENERTNEIKKKYEAENLWVR